MLDEHDPQCARAAPEASPLPSSPQRDVPQVPHVLEAVRRRRASVGSWAEIVFVD